MQEEWENDAPPLKRQKANSYTHLQKFALKPASLRRAASLKSDYEFATRSAVEDVNQELVPTEPATPVSGSSPCSERSFLAYGVAIIAPPPDHVASLPISTETMAKIRLQRFLERESSSRQYDGLGVPDVRRQEADLIATRQRDRNQHPETTQKDLWEDLLTIGQVLREDVVDWLLNVGDQVRHGILNAHMLRRYCLTNGEASQSLQGVPSIHQHQLVRLPMAQISLMSCQIRRKHASMPFIFSSASFIASYQRNQILSMLLLVTGRVS